MKKMKKKKVPKKIKPTKSIEPRVLVEDQRPKNPPGK